MASNNTVELLGRVPLFAELSEQELEQVVSVAIPRSFPKGAGCLQA